MKNFWFVFFVFSFFNFGCTRIIVKKGIKPYETIKNPQVVEKIREEKPYEVETKNLPSETKVEFVEGKVEILSEIPEGNYPNLRLGAIPERDPKTITIAFLQEELKKTGWSLFLTQKPILIETKGRNNKWYRGILAEKTILIGEERIEKERIEFIPKRIAFCWNEVRGVKIVIYPIIIKREEKTKEVVVERYRDIEKVSQVIIERYRDVDYTPAIWSGVGGIAIGTALGWFLKPAEEAVKVVPPTVITR